MNLKLKNKIVIVTGGGSGIGQAIAESLSKENAIPVIVDKNEKSINTTVRSLESKGKKVLHFLADLTDYDQCKATVAFVQKKSLSIAGLVNNAGINDKIGLENGTTEDFVQSYYRNVVHYYTMAKLCLPLLKQGQGSIVNIGSKVSTTGQGGTSGYAAATGARNALTREWAVELIPFKIRVNSVLVAEAFTPLYKDWVSTFPDPKKKIREIEDKIPFEKRMTTPKEIANTVTFLLSEKSSHTTGQLIYVDGGYTHLDRVI